MALTAAVHTAAEAIASAALARVADPAGSGRVRVEDYLTALGAVTGEAAVVASGVDIETSDLTPGAAILGPQINDILTGDDVANMTSVRPDSIVGILVDQLVPHTFELADFGSMEDLYRSVVANIGTTEWGNVHLTVGKDHAPTIPPIRLAFELRPAVDAACAAAGIVPAQRYQPCALALAGALVQVKEAIDLKVALKLALEVAFGMAKMAPMSQRAFADASQAPRTGSPEA